MAVSITLRNILKKYGSDPVLKNVTLGVERGHIHAIIGPTGAGKSVLLRIMATLSAPNLGSGYINGLNLSARQHQIRHQIGYLAQEPCIERELTLLENLLLHARLHAISQRDALARISAFATRFGVTDSLQRFPREVSHATLRKTEFIRAVLHNPSILLLDEPTASLDESSKLQLETFLREQRTRFTTVMVSSNLSQIEVLADRISLLKEGQVIADGTLAELQESDMENRVLEITLTESEDRDVTLLDGKEGVISYAMRGNHYEVITEQDVPPEKILSLFADRVQVFKPRQPNLNDLFLRLLKVETPNE